MRASLAGEWRQARPTQRFAYLVGGALMLAGVAYPAAWLVVGGAWQGPVSFRNPATFGTSFGLTTNTLAWVTGRLRVSGRTRWLLLGPLAAVRAVAGGGAWFDPGVAPRLLERYRRLVASASRQEAKLASLTDREHDVLRLMPRGAANAEIAVAMHVAEATVKAHVGSIFAKLGMRDRAAAIIFAATTVWSRPASRHCSSATLHPRWERNSGPRADAHRRRGGCRRPESV
jgi:DNA-binding CsgD family transcriptional regulator